MLKICKDGNVIALCEAPRWIRMQENGYFGACSEVEAEGIVINDMIYNIPGHDIGAAETVSYVEVDSGEYIFSQQEAAAVNDAAVSFVKIMMPTVELDDDQMITVSALYDDWSAGAYVIGDVRNAEGQTWECHQAHDNAVYPDIVPGSSSWATFWRPLHGKTPETARPWCKPVAGTTDMYHVGEYMIYTDGALYLCIVDTVYSPEEYAQAWEKQGEDEVAE